jgi:3-hydroxyisobutyrate dehydrogenase
MPTECVAFIGLGEMGMPMAAHVAASGRSVRAYDALGERRSPAAERGVDWAASVADATAAATRTVVVMVRTLAQVEDAVFGADGVLAAGRDPLDVVVMSTVDPGSLRDVAERAAVRGATVVDAPVSGGRKGAEDASLAIMASGPPDALHRVDPLLQLLGRHVHHVGEEAGHGQAVKLANQAMMAAAMAGTVEGLEIAERHGVDPQRVLDVVVHGTGGGWVVRNWDWMRSLWQDYEPGNALDVLDKDMRALLDVAGREWMALPVAAASFQRLVAFWSAQDAVRRGRGLDRP